MKQLAAILLLTLFVFNTIGYRLWIDYAQNKADIQLEAKLDKGHYNEGELITVKVPINLPYQNNWSDFERIDGEMNVNGTVYKYVKRKVYNDTMIFMCIPHEEKTKLETKANDYFGKVNGLPGNDKKAEVFKNLLSDFDINEQYKFASLFKISSSFDLDKDASCPQQYIQQHGQPPDSFFL